MGRIERFLLLEESANLRMSNHFQDSIHPEICVQHFVETKEITEKELRERNISSEIQKTSNHIESV